MAFDIAATVVGALDIAWGMGIGNLDKAGDVEGSAEEVCRGHCGQAAHLEEESLAAPATALADASSLRQAGKTQPVTGKLSLTSTQ